MGSNPIPPALSHFFSSDGGSIRHAPQGLNPDPAGPWAQSGAIFKHFQGQSNQGRSWSLLVRWEPQSRKRCTRELSVGCPWTFSVLGPGQADGLTPQPFCVLCTNRPCKPSAVFASPESPNRDQPRSRAPSAAVGIGADSWSGVFAQVKPPWRLTAKPSPQKTQNLIRGMQPYDGAPGRRATKSRGTAVGASILSILQATVSLGFGPARDTGAMPADENSSSMGTDHKTCHGAISISQARRHTQVLCSAGRYAGHLAAVVLTTFFIGTYLNDRL